MSAPGMLARTALAALAIVGPALLAAPAVAQPAAAAPASKQVLRVCQDPNNLPFSNRALEGFENKIAALLA